MLTQSQGLARPITMPPTQIRRVSLAAAMLQLIDQLLDRPALRVACSEAQITLAAALGVAVVGHLVPTLAVGPAPALALETQQEVVSSEILPTTRPQASAPLLTPVVASSAVQTPRHPVLEVEVVGSQAVSVVANNPLAKTQALARSPTFNQHRRKRVR